MAKIIERGADKWSLKHKCTHCDSLIEYEKRDLNYTPSSGQRDPESFYVICPACGHSKPVNGSEIPKLVKNEVKARYQSSRYSQWDR